MYGITDNCSRRRTPPLADYKDESASTHHSSPATTTLVSGGFQARHLWRLVTFILRRRVQIHLQYTYNTIQKNLQRAQCLSVGRIGGSGSRLSLLTNFISHKSYKQRNSVTHCDNVRFPCVI